ncbi:MAG: hypothetical protein IPG74_17890 [Flavobacteriales bacterium]|nr:hypothetical protein [Flavobacteriales bacterium]
MRSTVFIFFMVPALRLWAQQPVAELEPTTIRIGEQVSLKYTVAYRMDQGGGNVVWPVIGDTLPQRIEVVRDSGIDTIMPDKENDPYSFIQTRTLTVTSFDSGYWAVEPLRFVVNGDTVESNALVLTVNTVEVDTAQAIRDIKGIYEVPFSLMDWLKENWPWVAGGVAGIAGVVLALVFLLRRKPKTAIAIPEPVVPLHVRVLSGLDDIEGKRLWQQGLHKQYHSEVTDLLRGYIEERFGAPALEKTTDELLQELKLSSMRHEHREQLGNILRLADFVKFAKLTPAPAENEQLMMAARRFVQETTSPEPGATPHTNAPAHAH